MATKPNNGSDASSLLSVEQPGLETYGDDSLHTGDHESVKSKVTGFEAGLVWRSFVKQVSDFVTKTATDPTEGSVKPSSTRAFPHDLVSVDAHDSGQIRLETAWGAELSCLLLLSSKEIRDQQPAVTAKYLEQSLKIYIIEEKALETAKKHFREEDSGAKTEASDEARSDPTWWVSFRLSSAATDDKQLIVGKATAEKKPPDGWNVMLSILDKNKDTRTVKLLSVEVEMKDGGYVLCVREGSRGNSGIFSVEKC
ncbi:hypothetical protein QFC21_004838 [Naganishia friedmannii]|uniref:Uncharacterized protein n=1 Tax=Naganishia friedmannii TaxID=89922 RepID=A0ACC2VDW6_9TREE|nr:hypothetical protein QFC21_004838 [Naganishia friedmannii]